MNTQENFKNSIYIKNIILKGNMSENPCPKRNKLLIYRWSINLFLKLLNDWVPTTELGSYSVPYNLST